MKEIKSLLVKLENEIDNLNLRAVGIKTKDQIKIEVDKMYAFYTLEMCKLKLKGKDFSECKEALLRTKSIYEKLKSLK
ncbi:hypothetical protein HERIO_204 [Hepatospora eriocheir]|uniref:BAG domain-containing protein n=1 Tax=Hepatospora eriocheir TaxID=1081669 RepID=A0A1X0QDS6_9MICR|nr:hypothetical protein HERIO_204 [Hepatospora eriocheir]